MRGSTLALLAALTLAAHPFDGPGAVLAASSVDRRPSNPRPPPTPDAPPAFRKFRRAQPDHRTGKAAALARRTRNAGRL